MPARGPGTPEERAARKKLYMAEYSKRYQAANRLRLNHYLRAYYAAHRDHLNLLSGRSRQRRRAAETPEAKAQRLARRRVSRARDRQLRGDILRAQERAARVRSGDKYRARLRQYRKDHPELKRKADLAYRTKYREAIRVKKHAAQMRLDAWIVAKRMGRRVRDIHPEMIDAKRAILQVKRYIGGRK